MSTREDMRRELRDLAKMATKMTGAQASSSSSARAAQAPRTASLRTESRITVPPTTAPIPYSTNARSIAIRTPTAVVLPVGAALPKDRERKGSLLAIMAGLGLAAAMVGGIAVGRSLAEGSAPAVEGAVRPAATAPPAAATVLPRATVVAVMDSTMPAGLTPPPAASPAPIVIAATRVASFAAPPRRPIPHYGQKPGPVPSSSAESRPAPTHESLEELMRRSVAAQSAKR